MPNNLQASMALTPRKGDAASVRRQSRQRLRSERRYIGVCARRSATKPSACKALSERRYILLSPGGLAQ